MVLFGVGCAFTLVLLLVSPAANFETLHETPAINIHHEQRRGILCDKCWCNETLADCSEVHFNTQEKYIPRVPNSIRIFMYRENQLRNFTDTNVFKNVTFIEKLDLSRNDIRKIGKKVFDLMPNLTHLDISWSRLVGPDDPPDFSSFENVLSNPRLQSVICDFCDMPNPPRKFLTGVKNSRMVLLSLSYNQMSGWLKMSFLCRLRDLRDLNLANNKIEFITTDCNIGLERFDLSNNLLTGFISTCDPQGYTRFPLLDELRLTSNGISSVEGKVCLPNLRVLDLRYNHIGKYLRSFDTFSDWNFPDLTSLDLSGNHIHFFFYKRVLGSSPIQKFIFKENFFNFALMENDTFSNCNFLSHLELDDNDFSLLTEEKFHVLFSTLPIKHLSLSRTGFEVITAKTFSVFHALEILDLSNNKIVSLPNGAFDALVHLVHLNLSFNRITLVAAETFNMQFLNNIQTLAFEGNPFVCSCDLIWFQTWSSSHPAKLLLDRKKYQCSNSPLTLSEFAMAPQACLLSKDACVMIIMVTVSFTLLMTTTSLLHRYRWHIRLLLYEAFRGRHEDRRRQRLQANFFAYDLFVSYASEDLSWIHQHLQLELEDRLGLRLCIHERDFIPGHNIVDNIAESVEGSKKILMVFSKHFLCSQWCQFELTYCLRHVMDHDDVLIIVCLDDVASRDMSTAMMAVLRTTTYIQWWEHQDATAAFWGRLYIALDDVLHREAVV